MADGLLLKMRYPPALRVLAPSTSLERGTVGRQWPPWMVVIQLGVSNKTGDTLEETPPVSGTNHSDSETTICRSEIYVRCVASIGLTPLVTAIFRRSKFPVSIPDP